MRTDRGDYEFTLMSTIPGGGSVMEIRTIPPMTPAAIARVREIEDYMLATQPQFDLEMHHQIHAGVYARTCLLPAGIVMTGALIKIATTLTIAGDVMVWLGGEGRRITGYAVLAASAGRKQAFRAIADTHITMSFRTDAKTVAEAEREFTDEFSRLAPGRATTIITGEPAQSPSRLMQHAEAEARAAMSLRGLNNGEPA